MRAVEGSLGHPSNTREKSRGRRTEIREAWQFPVLAQRAVADSPRWTPAVWGKPSPSSNERWGERKEAAGRPNAMMDHPYQKKYNALNQLLELRTYKIKASQPMQAARLRFFVEEIRKDSTLTTYVKAWAVYVKTKDRWTTEDSQELKDNELPQRLENLLTTGIYWLSSRSSASMSSGST